MTTLLFDVAPDPVSSGVGPIVFILIGVAVLIFSLAVIVGSIFLLRWLLRAKPAAPPVSAAPEQGFQPSNPNQP